MHSEDGTPAKRDVTPVSETDVLAARDLLQLMLIEYGNVHIETLGQLLRLTQTAELEYSRICVRRLCN
jgi:hypothetical protein